MIKVLKSVLLKLCKQLVYHIFFIFSVYFQKYKLFRDNVFNSLRPNLFFPILDLMFREIRQKLLLHVIQTDLVN